MTDKAIDGLTAATTIASADLLMIETAAGNSRKVTGANAKAALSGLTLLEQHTASSSATLDFTTAITSTFDEYVIELLNVIPATNAVNFYMLMSTDGGATYDSGANYAWVSFVANRFGSGAAGADSSATQIQTNENSIDNTSTAGLCGRLTLFSPGSTSVHKYVTGEYTQLNSASIERVNFSGAYRSTTAVNAFRFLFSSGNIASGIIRVYGIAKV